MARGKKAKQKRKIKNANGYGTVYRLSGTRRKPWMVRVTAGWDLTSDIDGRPHKRQKYETIGYTESEEEGLLMLEEYHNRKKCGYDILKQTETFGSIYDKVIPRHLEDKSKSSIAGYNAAKARLKPIWDIPIRDIKTSILQQIIDKMHNDEHLSKRPMESVKTSASLVFRYAEQNDIVNKNYADYIKIPKVVPKNPKHPFTPTDINTLFKHDDLPYVDTVLILIYTGLRIDELLKTRTADVYLDDRYFITGSKTDTGKDRIIPIPHLIHKYISEWYDKDNKYLIHNGRGKRLEQNHYRDDIFKPLLKTLGIKSHLPHECRHTFATITDNANINRVVQQKILGHKGKSITERTYIHKDVVALLEEIDRVFPDNQVSQLC